MGHAAFKGSHGEMEDGGRIVAGRGYLRVTLICLGEERRPDLVADRVALHAGVFPRNMSTHWILGPCLILMIYAFQGADRSLV